MRRKYSKKRKNRPVYLKTLVRDGFLAVGDEIDINNQGVIVQIRDLDQLYCKNDGKMYTSPNKVAKVHSPGYSSCKFDYTRVLTRNGITLAQLRNTYNEKRRAQMSLFENDFQIPQQKIVSSPVVQVSPPLSTVNTDCTAMVEENIVNSARNVTLAALSMLSEEQKNDSEVCREVAVNSVVSFFENFQFVQKTIDNENKFKYNFNNELDTAT